MRAGQPDVRQLLGFALLHMIQDKVLLTTTPELSSWKIHGREVK
jgi:hypothetical protein